MWRASSGLLKRAQLYRQDAILSNHVRAFCTNTLAIRREDDNPWERRAPFSPAQVRQLIKMGYTVLVQPSNRRAYPIQEYVSVGAVITEDISDASVILGVKQVPINSLIPERSYVFFSHTIKAQVANMKMLDVILEKKIRLIDYEKMVDKTGRRLVAFGKYAGVAGMINILHGLGLRLLALGHHTPFMHIGPAHNYRSSGMAQQAIRDAGYEVSLGLMPKSIGPLVFVFTGTGNVSQGAQEIFQSLPHEYVSVENLPKVAQHGAQNKIYGCVVDMEDNLVRKTDGGFDVQEYFDHPDRYASTFGSKVAPYASVIINGIFYAPGAPRLITIPDARKLLQPSQTPWIQETEGCPKLPHRLVAICDISADPGGSIEFMRECTTINKPFVLYDVEQNVDSESFSGDGVLICSVDNMPAQIPRESTDFFGSLLMPHVHDLMMSDARKPLSEYKGSRVVGDAIIASNGELAPKFKYIEEMRNKNRVALAARVSAMEAHKKVLILGAGFVSAPVVDYLTRDTRTQVTVVSSVKNEVDYLAKKFPNTCPTVLDIHKSRDELDSMVQGHDLIISLLPYALHPEIAKLCIKYKRHLVTASYTSLAMNEMASAIKDAGIIIMNEVGLDPGIDHLLAMECFDEIKQHGGKVTSFISYCGGLPAPEDSENPLRYKFSWSPRGVLANVMSGAKYLENGKIIQVDEGGALLDATQPMSFLPGYNLEGFPNRDSISYAKLYGIESAHTILRGTLRYKGFSHAMKGLIKLGVIDVNEHPLLHPGGPQITWRQLISELTGCKQDVLPDALKDHIYNLIGRDNDKLAAIIKLGLLDDVEVKKFGTPLDTLSGYLVKRLAFGPGERDMIVMRHDVGVEWSDRSTETRHIDMVVYGDPHGYSAMAATVGYPTGITAKMILDGEIEEQGLLLPFKKDIYRPILKKLSKEKITAREHITNGQSAQESEFIRY